jgi:hypothetical protein
MAAVDLCTFNHGLGIYNHILLLGEKNNRIFKVNKLHVQFF